MCGRFALPDETAVSRILRITRWNWHWPEPRFNVAPTTRVPMVFRADDALLELGESFNLEQLLLWASDCL